MPLRVACSAQRTRRAVPVILMGSIASLAQIAWAQLPNPPPGDPPTVELRDAQASTEEEMRRYTESLGGLDMLPIPGGTFRMGSPESEGKRREDEGPLRRIEIEPFWMGRTEVTWDLYRQFTDGLDLQRPADATEPQAAWADAVSRPTTPYVPMDFGMGTDGFPAISMTQFAARHFTKWLSMKTGRFYRLPSEAEWEYACRTGSQSSYGFGDDPRQLARSAWFERDTYQRVGLLEPNAWGLHDLQGNVSEWVLDERSSYPSADTEVPTSPVVWPSEEYGRVVRGGSFNDSASELRCAARRASSSAWKRSDPQLPQSIWFLTHARFVGLRVVRPLHPPPRDTWSRYWEPDLAPTQRLLDKQRRTGHLGRHPAD